jgi:hypothetical protein
MEIEVKGGDKLRVLIEDHHLRLGSRGIPYPGKEEENMIECV